MEVRAPPGSRPRPPTPRRGVTLAEQLAASSNLRDLLKLREDVDRGEGEGRPAAAARRRTLLDVIRDADEGRRPPAVASVRRGVRPAPAPGGTGTGTATAAPGSAARGESQRVSLMALLERTEQQQWTWKRAGGAEEAAPEDAEEEKEKGSGGVGGRCCVCVARGKGAAFIPCGHTFCRACARELRAGRGRCPLCNATIREVLNLF
ncbi:uncharacterized protein [Miscanthus floridulus]|uniref:uncharacterized protein n=1 Tax=Miscanthus floridulus TaxID=154761 RepID=UPI00345AFEEF